MAPPRTLVTAVCVILAAPLSYAVYRNGFALAALATLVVVGVLLPRLYAAVAVPNAADR